MKKGFTLVELLVVVTIIGIVVALLIPAARQAAMVSKANNQCQAIAQRLVRGDAVSQENDPWETPIQAFIDGDKITVVSAGPDKNFETEDDVVVVKYQKIMKQIGKVVGHQKEGAKAEKPLPVKPKAEFGP